MLYILRKLFSTYRQFHCSVSHSFSKATNSTSLKGLDIFFAWPGQIKRAGKFDVQVQKEIFVAIKIWRTTSKIFEKRKYSKHLKSPTARPWKTAAEGVKNLRPAAETIFGTLILVQKKVWKSLEFDLKKTWKKSGKVWILTFHFGYTPCQST